MGSHRYPLMRPHSRLMQQLVGQYPNSVNAALERYLWLVAIDLPIFFEEEWVFMMNCCKGWDSASQPPEDTACELKRRILKGLRRDETAIESLGISREFPYKISKLGRFEAIAVIHEIEQRKLAQADQESATVSQ